MKKYEANERYPYEHYKNGVRTFGAAKITTKISIVVSTIVIFIDVLIILAK